MVPHSAHLQLFPGDLQTDTDDEDDAVTHGGELKLLLIVPQRINEKKREIWWKPDEAADITGNPAQCDAPRLQCCSAPLHTLYSLMMHLAVATRCCAAVTHSCFCGLNADTPVPNRQASRCSESPLFCRWYQKRTLEMMFSASEDQKFIYKKHNEKEEANRCWRISRFRVSWGKQVCLNIKASYITFWLVLNIVDEVTGWNDSPPHLCWSRGAQPQGGYNLKLYEFICVLQNMFPLNPDLPLWFCSCLLLMDSIFPTHVVHIWYFSNISVWTHGRNLTSDALFCVLRLKLKAQVVIRVVHVRALKISIDATDIGGDLANAGAVIASAPRCWYPVWIKFPASVSSQSHQESCRRW